MVNVAITSTTHQVPLYELHAQASSYAELGLYPIPMRFNEKIPAVRWKSYAFTSNSWRRPHNIALRTGKEFGIGVVDFDSASVFAKAAVENSEITSGKFPVVQTARGFHVYYRPKTDGPSRRFPGGDIQERGKLIMAPPSIHRACSISLSLALSRTSL